MRYDNKTLCIIETQVGKKKNSHTFNFEFKENFFTKGGFEIIVTKRPYHNPKKLREVNIEARGGFEYLVLPIHKLKTREEAKQYAEIWAIQFCQHIDFKRPFNEFLRLITNPNGRLQTPDGLVWRYLHIDF